MSAFHPLRTLSTLALNSVRRSKRIRVQVERQFSEMLLPVEFKEKPEVPMRIIRSEVLKPP